jgi:putative transcriptional regulator
MIRCHLGRLLGERKLKIADAARATGLNRSTLTALYKETATRVEVSTLNALCEYLGCTVADLLEYVPDRKKGR